MSQPSPLWLCCLLSSQPPEFVPRGKEKKEERGLVFVFFLCCFHGNITCVVFASPPSARFPPRLPLFFGKETWHVAYQWSPLTILNLVVCVALHGFHLVRCWWLKPNSAHPLKEFRPLNGPILKIAATGNLGEGPFEMLEGLLLSRHGGWVCAASWS